jgi:hypothetical protein
MPKTQKSPLDSTKLEKTLQLRAARLQRQIRQHDNKIRVHKRTFDKTLKKLMAATLELTDSY